MSSVLVSEILEHLNERAPLGSAEDWDNVGLLIGDKKARSQGAVVSIDLTRESLNQAKKLKYGLIVTHHPVIFPKNRGLSQVCPGMTSETKSSLVYEAIRNGIAVISCHTNFDRCSLEVVDHISKGLQVKPRGRLIERADKELMKLAVFVPETHTDSVRDAICRAGAGQIGNYDFCTFSVHGEGTFKGSDETDPFLGKPGVLERAPEHRLETIFPKGLEKKVLSALLKAHPYEEVAYDLYPVVQKVGAQGLVHGLGYGFWGEVLKPVSFSVLAKRVKALFQVSGFRVTPSGTRQIRKIAFTPGNGSSFVNAAIHQEVDLYITGELGYHEAIEAARSGMSVIELGHRESERFFLITMTEWLKNSGLKVKALNEPTQKLDS